MRFSWTCTRCGEKVVATFEHNLYPLKEYHKNTECPYAKCRRLESLPLTAEDRKFLSDLKVSWEDAPLRV